MNLVEDTVFLQTWSMAGSKQIKPSAFLKIKTKQLKMMSLLLDKYQFKVNNKDARTRSMCLVPAFYI